VLRFYITTLENRLSAMMDSRKFLVGDLKPAIRIPLH
jgi:hypothetical protein